MELHCIRMLIERFACVTASATEVTVSADVEKMKIDEMPMTDVAAASDKRDVQVDIERRAADATKSEPGITAPHQGAADTTTTEGSISKPESSEVNSEVVEGDIVKLSEEKYSEDTLSGCTTVRKNVITTKHMRPVTTIVRNVSGAEEQFTVDKLLGTEVHEHRVILEPGVLQLRDDQLENETQVETSEDKAEDGTWIKRAVTTVTVKCKKTSAEQRETEKPAEHRKVTEPPASGAVSAEVPLKESLDLNASPQPGANLIHQDTAKANLGQQPSHASDVDSAKRLETETRHAEVDLDRKLEDDQYRVEPKSKPSIIPVKLTKLEPLSKDRTTSVTADADVRKPAEVEQKSSTDVRDATKPQQARSGSPSLSVVRLTKLEPLSFERSNGSAVSDQPRVEPIAEPRDGSSAQRAPAESRQPAEQPDKPSITQPTTEDMIVPVPSAGQMRGRPASIQPTTAPHDDDLDVHKTMIQAEQAVDQFTAAPPNIKPVDEHEITETLASTPGSVIIL